MPLGYNITNDIEDDPRFFYQQRRTRLADIYMGMSSAEYFQAREDYYSFHPAANHKSWRKYLEDLADDEYEILEAEIVVRSRYRRDSLTSGPRRADRVESYTSYAASSPYGDDASYGEGHRCDEDRRHHGEDLADQVGDFNTDGRSSQRGAEPTEYRALISRQRNPYNGEHRPNKSQNASSGHCAAEASRPRKSQMPSELGARLDRLGDSDIDTIIDRERVRQPCLPGPEHRSPGGWIHRDDLKPSTPKEPSRIPTTGRQNSTGSNLPLIGHLYINTGPSNAQQRPQPCYKSDHGQDCPINGRYNAGVRAPRSADVLWPSIHSNDGRACSSNGRYNMGVRVPRS